MKKTQVIIVAIAATAVVGLFSLPRVIVSNGKETLSETVKDSVPHNEAEHEEGGHDHSMISHTMIDSARINRLRNSFLRVSDLRKKIIFADSLALVFQKAGMFDSATTYCEFIAVNSPSDKNTVKAGDAWYQAFSTAPTADVAKVYGDKARTYYKTALEKNPNQLDIKSKLAMTYVTTDNPMQGITLLREVIQKDPKNELALFNLGLLSMQSGQFDKAIDRFKSVLDVNQSNSEAKYYLALCYKETGNKTEAINLFESIKRTESDPAILELSEGALKELK